jgi:hypothetical protein
MGRGVAKGPVPAEWLAANFTVDGATGALIRKACGAGGARFVGGPASYRDTDGVLRTRFTYQGARRTMASARIAWILTRETYPRGQVVTIGDGADLKPENLTVVDNCLHKPWTKGGGQASSLQRRAEIDRLLLSAMAEHEGAALTTLAKLAGLAEGRISVKLTRLAERGLAESPRCCPGKAWVLSAQGRAVAMGETNALDELDKTLLTTLAGSNVPLRQLGLARRCGVCTFTIKRRIGLLADRGLVLVRGPQFLLTDAGRKALGPEAPVVKPWFNPAMISAAAARDVRERVSIPEQTSVARSENGRLARAKARSNAKRGLTVPFNAFALDRLAG